MEQLTAPCHLWVGNQTTIRHDQIKMLQQALCKQGGCGHCVACTGIVQEQHHAVIWIRPENFYTRETLEPIFSQLAFALNPQERFFFILENVDFMPAACANSLLKSLEEPPAGYHFFMGAQRLQAVLPTIRSRSIIHQMSNTNEQEHHPLFDFFTSSQFHDPAIFLKELEQSAINERESVELVDQILVHWIDLLKQTISARDHVAYKRQSAALATITAAFRKLPMPGSSKLFWKDFYLAMKAH